MRPELVQARLQKLFASPEELLTSEYGFGLTTATPLQRALAYVMCSRPVPDHYLADPSVLEAFGGVPPKVTKEVVVCSAIRCAKTLEAVCGVTWDTQHCRMPPGLRPGEVPRVSLVSKYTDQAEAAMDYLRGAFTTSPILKSILLDMSAERLLVRHPTGAPIEIMVVAGARSGTTLISRWMAGMIFDEAPRIASETDGVVNLEAMRSAVIGRVLDGASIRYVGSPVGATGMIYKMVSENWEKPDQKITVVRAKGPLMNPYWWTPEHCEELRLADPDAYRTDVLGEFLDPEANLFTHGEVDESMTLPSDVQPEAHHNYTACIDPATRGNSWTFGIADTTDNRKYRMVFECQWTGSSSEPLSPKEVLTELVPHLRRFRIKTVLTDQWAVDALRDIVRDLSASIYYEFELAPVIITSAIKTKMFLGLKARFTNGAIELRRNDTLREDLLRVKRRVNGGGDISIKFTETADGRHADYAAMLAMLCGKYIEESPSAAPVSKTRITDEDDDWLFEDDQSKLDMYEQADAW